MKPVIIGVAVVILIVISVTIWYFTKGSSEPSSDSTPPGSPSPVTGSPSPVTGSPSTVPSAPIIPTGTPAGNQTGGYTVYTKQRCTMTGRMITSVTVPANASTTDIQNLCNQTSGCNGATTDGHGNWVLLSSINMTGSNVDTCMVKN